MIPFRIENWQIDQTGIRWDGEQKIDYVIPRTRILQTRDNMFDWLIHMAEKTWLSKEDIYSLNTAFIYSIEAYGLEFPKEISFVETIRFQQNELEDKEE